MKLTATWAGAGILASLVFSVAADNVSPFGVCSHITRDEDADQVFARCVEAGIRNVRSDFDWWRFQNKPEEWKSSRFTEILAKARTAGVTVLPIATGGCNFSSPTSGTTESFRRFGAFVGRLVGDFKDDLPVVEIWNEQNIGGFWPPKPNVAHYVGTLREAYKAAKAANPSVRVAFGGTAGPDVGFYQQAYANGAKDCFDIVNIHPYCMPNAPEGWLERQLGLMRETMARNGDAAKPIWITEMGWATREIEWPKSECGMVRGAFKALGLDGRKNLRVLAIEQSHPGPTDRWFSDVWRQELPEGAVLVNCTYGDVTERLGEAAWDAVVMPFDESCPLHATEALVNHVRRGGALIDFGGVPGYFSFRREKDGTIVNGPNGNEEFRKALRIEACHKGCDSSVAANGFDTGTDGVKNYPGWRSFGTKYLRPGDAMKPMMVGPGGVAVAALYEFNSDFTGKIFTAGRALVFVGCATSERTQAAMTVRSALTAVRLGVEKYFVYEFQSPETSRTNPESHFGLLHKDYTPKPAFQAYKTLIGLWPEGSTVLTDKSWRSEGLYRVAWRQPNGTRVTAVWTDGASKSIPAEKVAGVNVVDLYGRPVAVGKGLIVGTDPVFLIGQQSCCNSSLVAATPLAVFGVLGDVHIDQRHFDEPGGGHSVEVFRTALRILGARAVDGVVIAGDLTQDGGIAELKRLEVTWREVFPDDRRFDGQRVERLFALGDHDVEKPYWFLKYCPDDLKKPELIADLTTNHIAYVDRAKVWKDVFGEDFVPIMRKTVKGYDFVLAHLVNADEDGLRYADPLYIPGLEEFFATNSFDRTKPFFYVQHKIPRGTVGGQYQSGQDSGRTTAILSRYPNAVGFNGHKHRTATEELSLWQGAFTQIQAPGLATLLTAAGRENSRCSCEAPCSTPPQQMEQIDTRFDGSHAMIVSVYRDRLVVERIDVLHNGEPVAEPWIVKLPNDGSAGYDVRGRTAGVPQFAAGAKVSVVKRRGRDRTGNEGDQVVVSFPPAGSTKAAPRAYDYEVTAVLSKGVVSRVVAQKRVYSSKCYWPERYDTNDVVCVFGRAEIPDNHESVKFVVRPMNAWGKAGEEIESVPDAYWPKGPLYPF